MSHSNLFNRVFNLTDFYTKRNIVCSKQNQQGKSPYLVISNLNVDKILCGIKGWCLQSSRHLEKNIKGIVPH